jgi:hypothetical protein
MAYWVCASCGTENHDAFARCTRCALVPKREPSNPASPAESDKPELTSSQRRMAVGLTWILFLSLSSLSHRGDLASLLPFTVLLFPVGLIALFEPKSDGDFTVWFLFGWLLYAALTTIALSATKKRAFNKALFALAFVLALNMVGCLKMGR